MLPKTNEGTTDLKRYLDLVKDPEVKPIPKKDEKPKVTKKDDKPDWADKKNDDFNEYDYSSDPNQDDKQW